MKLTDDEIKEIVIESGFWSDNESLWCGEIPEFKVFAMKFEEMLNHIADARG